MKITLCQFEQINDLFNACLRRPALEDIIQHPLASRSYITETYYRPEWKLLDACVEATSLDYVNGHPCAVDAAAAILTGCLTCSIEIIDELEAA